VKVHTIIVFPDGETWNTLDGCTIKTITDEDFRSIVDDRMDASDAKAVVELQLTNIT
jgi:hypothetical protein